MTPRSDHPGWDPAKLRRAREENGLTQEQLADAVDSAPQTVRRHETGASWPHSPALRDAYSRVLNRTGVELGFWPPDPPVGRASVGGSEVASDGHSADVALSGHEEEATTNRREILEALAATAGLTLAGLPVLSPAQRLLGLEKTASGDTVLSLAENQLSEIVAKYSVTPPGDLLANIAFLQRFADGIGQLNLLPAESSRLWRLSAISAGLRGWVHNNAGDPVSARVSLAEAHRRGQLLKDDQIIAWTRYMQSVVEDYAGNTAGAERYAVDGLRHAHTGPQRAILLAEQVTAICAARGDLAGVDRAAGEATEIAIALRPEEQKPANSVNVLAALDSYSSLDCAAYSGTAYSRLGRPDRVAQITAEAREAADRTGTHHRSYFRLDEALAIARSKDPDPERIAALTREGLDLALPFQKAHLGSRLTSIVRSTDVQRQHPAIRTLNEQAREWKLTQAVSGVL